MIKMMIYLFDFFSDINTHEQQIRGLQFRVSQLEIANHELKRKVDELDAKLTKHMRWAAAGKR